MITKNDTPDRVDIDLLLVLNGQSVATRIVDGVFGIHCLFEKCFLLLFICTLEQQCPLYG